MTRERFEFLKGVANRFRGNPFASEYLGISRQTCFSLLALHFSTPQEILDPTRWDFLTKASKKIKETQGKINQGQPLPETLLSPKDLDKDLDKTVQDWDAYASALPKPVPQENKNLMKGYFEEDLKRGSLNAWQRTNPQIAPKINRYLNRPVGRMAGKIGRFLTKGKALAKTAAFLGKAASVIGTALLAVSFLTSKPVRKAFELIGEFFIAFYAFLAWLGMGALIGGILGGIAGGIAGAILGFKLGILLCSPLLAIPIAGPLLYAVGVGVFTVGGAIFGAISGAIGGAALGFAIEHWVWRPIQGAWNATTGFLGNLWGGAQSFIGGLWSGFWSGVGNFFTGLWSGAGSLLNGALSWAGGALEATASGIANLFGQLSTISIAEAATLPTLGTVGIVGGGTVFFGVVTATAFMSPPPPPLPPGPPPSEYVEIQKTVSPKTNFTNAELPTTVTYTITASAKTSKLINVQVTDVTTVVKEGSPPSVPPFSWGPLEILPGAPWTSSYDLTLTEDFQNSAVTNVVTVTADVEDGPSGETASATLTIIIGGPSPCADPSSVLCWAQKINEALEKGSVWGGSRYNRLITRISNGSYTTGVWPGTEEGNLYWCTYLVVDAYTLAGHSGLSVSAHASVWRLAAFWRSAPGYTFIDYHANRSLLQNVRPGDAVFFQQDRSYFSDYDHTAIVKQISINGSGDGFFLTYDSNNLAKIINYPVSGWVIKNPANGAPDISFGSH